jgi:hypothetical protein
MNFWKRKRTGKTWQRHVAASYWPFGFQSLTCGSIDWSMVNGQLWPGRDWALAGRVGPDADMAPSDTTIDYNVCSFLHLHSNFGYNSLSSTYTRRYLNVGTNVSQNTSPSKLNFRFVCSPIVLHWEGHNSSIRSAIEVNEHLMESFDKLSNRSSPTLISHWQGLQIIETFCGYFYRVLRCRRGLVILTWDPGPS